MSPTAEALRETRASVHTSWPSVSRGRTQGCKWQARLISLRWLAIPKQKFDSEWQGFMWIYWVYASHSLSRIWRHICIMQSSPVNAWPCPRSVITLLEVTSHKCVCVMKKAYSKALQSNKCVVYQFICIWLLFLSKTDVFIFKHIARRLSMPIHKTSCEEPPYFR